VPLSAIKERLGHESIETTDKLYGYLVQRVHDQVLAALDRLRDADREILRLAAWEELSHREIAQVVGCSDASVAVRLHRARNRLGREIQKEERRAGQEPRADPGWRAEGQET